MPLTQVQHEMTSFSSPTIQRFTSGSGTYTTPAGVRWIRVRMVGGGGGAGGYVDAIIASPSATYAHAVGTGGSAGTAGTSGYVGGAGGSGQIIVDEYYA